MEINGMCKYCKWGKLCTPDGDKYYCEWCRKYTVAEYTKVKCFYYPKTELKDCYDVCSKFEKISSDK